MIETIAPAQSMASGTTLLRNLGIDVSAAAIAAAPKKELDFAVDGLAIEEEGGKAHEDGSRRYALRDGQGGAWSLHTKVVLDDATLNKLAHLVARLAPKGSTARLQADGHSAGNVFVGLVLSYDETRIPVNLVSGDIGCGLTLVPVVDRRGEHRSAVAPEDAIEYYSLVEAKFMRPSLKRGNIAERGLTDTKYLHEAAAFYGQELDPWLKNMGEVLAAVGLIAGPVACDKDAVLAYIGRFTQSLGSSGNHFMELSVDDHGRQWLVVHSGSRALGAMVYGAIAEACRITSGGFEVATGELARFYTRAYDALNLFAKLNRVICAIAVLDAMGCETSASLLHAAMAASPIFGPGAVGARELMSGLTHNGLKAFVNHKERTVMYVLSKGAVAVSRRESAIIVALRAGEGCVVITLVDPTCEWREVALEEARSLAYDVVLDAEGGVVFAGHGAGRSQSTSETARRSTFRGLAEYFARKGIVGNIAPGVLGDNPEMAYKPSSEILPHLPLDIARTHSMLRTCVAHKEGITFRKADQVACAEYIRSVTLTDRLAPLCCDYNLVRAHLTDAEYEDGCKRRDAIIEALVEKWMN